MEQDEPYHCLALPMSFFLTCKNKAETSKNLSYDNNRRISGNEGQGLT